MSGDFYYLKDKELELENSSLGKKNDASSENPNVVADDQTFSSFLADYFTSSLAFSGDNYTFSLKKQNKFGIKTSVDLNTLFNIPFLSLPLAGNVEVSKGREQLLMVFKLGECHNASKQILYNDLRGKNYSAKIAINFTIGFDAKDLLPETLDLSELEVAGISVDITAEASLDTSVHVKVDLSLLKGQEQIETSSLSDVKRIMSNILTQDKASKLDNKNNQTTTFGSIKFSAGSAIGFTAELGGSAKIGDISSVIPEKYKSIISLDKDIKEISESSALELSASVDVSAKLNIAVYPQYYWYNTKLDNNLEILRYGTSSIIRSFFTCGANAKVKVGSSLATALGAKDIAEVSKSFDKEVILLDTYKGEELLLYYNKKDNRGKVEYNIDKGCGINYTISLSLRNLITLVVANNKDLSRDRDIDKYISKEFEKNSRDLVKNLSKFLRIKPKDLEGSIGNLDLSLLNDIGNVINLNSSVYTGWS